MTNRETGVREKKRREMHRQITEVGLTLFAEKGFEATTLDEIAEASGIARRTLFHYFSSKEEIILAWQNSLPESLHAEILKQGDAQTPFDALRTALMSLTITVRPDIAVLIGTVTQSTEQLRLGNQAKFLKMEEAASAALTTLWPQPELQLAIRLTAMTAIGALRLSVEIWLADACRQPLKTCLENTFRHLA